VILDLPPVALAARRLPLAPILPISRAYRKWARSRLGSGMVGAEAGTGAPGGAQPEKRSPAWIATGSVFSSGASGQIQRAE
jgi:hypothetical protein